MKKLIIYSIIAGLIITLLSGLIPTLGTNNWGSPFPWINNSTIIYPNILFDTIIWSVIIYLGYYLFSMAKK